MRRWVFIISYNRASNNPVYDSHHPQYTPLEKVRILELIEVTKGGLYLILLYQSKEETHRYTLVVNTKV